MTKKKEYETLHVDVEFVSMKSIKVVNEEFGEVFIPISVIEDGDMIEEGHDQDINVESWFCEKEGLA